MVEEFNVLQEQGIWSLLPCETAMNVAKVNPNGTIALYITRLVSKGYHQVEGR